MPTQATSMFISMLFIHSFISKQVCFFIAYCCILNVGFLDCVGLELFLMRAQMCGKERWSMLQLLTHLAKDRVSSLT